MRPLRFFFLMIRRPPRSTQSRSSAASDVYKRQEQEKYLTISVERKTFEEAKAQFATIEVNVRKAFNELGTDIQPLSGNERLRILHDFYNLGKEDDCLLYTSDAADDLLCVDLGGCRII